MCPQTLLDCHNQTEAVRALCFFFYWTTMDKLELTDWSQVNRLFGHGEITIFRQLTGFVFKQRNLPCSFLHPKPDKLNVIVQTLY